MNGPAHPRDIVLDPLDHVGAAPGRVRGQLIHLLVQPNLELAVNLQNIESASLNN